MDENNEEVVATTPVSESASRASSVYPEATKGTYGAMPDRPAYVAPQSSKSGSNLIPALVLLFVGLAIGVLLGRTVFKAPPTPEEATKALFGEALDDFADQFDASQLSQ